MIAHRTVVDSAVSATAVALYAWMPHNLAGYIMAIGGIGLVFTRWAVSLIELRRAWRSRND